MELEACHCCGYEIDLSVGAVCPECGVDVGAEVRRVRDARGEVLERMGHQNRVQLWFWGIVIVVYGIGAMVASGSLMALPVVVGAFSIGVLGSMGVGLLCAFSAPEGERVFFRYAWVRCFPLLHVPWLLVGPLTGIGVCAGLVVRVFDLGEAGAVLEAGALFCFLGWLLAWAASGLVWLARVIEWRNRLRL